MPEVKEMSCHPNSCRRRQNFVRRSTGTIELGHRTEVVLDDFKSLHALSDNTSKKFVRNN
jgi:hypothetical protein